MDLTLTESEQEFRDDFRAWLSDNHPGKAPRGGDQVQFEFEREWQRKLHDAGWAGVSWPKEYGGRGATLIEQSIFGEELARAKAPRPANVLGLVMGGPVMIAHGTEPQAGRDAAPAAASARRARGGGGGGGHLRGRARKCGRPADEHRDRPAGGVAVTPARQRVGGARAPPGARARAGTPAAVLDRG